MPRFFPPDFLNYVTSSGNVVISAGMTPFPAIYAPINKAGDGINALRPDNSVIVSTFNPYIGYGDTAPGGEDSVRISQDDDLRFHSGPYTSNTQHLGKALTLNGSTQYASISDNAGLSITDNLTLEAFIKLDTLVTEQTIIGKWDETTANDHRSYRLYINASDRLVLAISSDGTAGNTTEHVGTSTLFSVNKWYHVAASFVGSTSMDVYVNGVADVAQKTSSVPASIDDNASTLYIGGKENTSGSVDTLFDGQIDEVRIFDTLILTTAKISDDFKSAYEVQDDTNLVANWKFNEGDDFTDSTANGHNLTGTGTPTFSINYEV